MKKKLVIIIVVFFSAILGLVFINLKNMDNVIIVGVDRNYWPMTYAENQSYSGFEIDLANEVFTIANINYKIKAIDWSIKEELLNDGKIDCIWSGMTINSDRLSLYSFTPIYLTSNNIIVTNNTKETCISNLNDVVGKRVGIYLISSSAYNFINSKYSDMAYKVNYYNSINELFEALQANDIDLIITDEIYARAKVRNDMNSYNIIDTTLGSESYAVAFPLKCNKNTLLAISNAISEAAKNGTIEKLSNKWFGKNMYFTNNKILPTQK